MDTAVTSEPAVEEDVAAAAPAALRLSASALRRWGLASLTQPPSAVPDERANGLAFSDSGRVLVSSHNDGSIRILNGSTGEPDGIFRMKDHGCKLITATHHESCFLHAANAKPTEETVGVVAYHSLHDNSVIRYFRAHTQRCASRPHRFFASALKLSPSLAASRAFP